MVELSESSSTSDPRLDYLERLKAKTDERRAAVESARQAVATLTGEATSPDRLVTVKVNPQGALLDLKLDADVRDLEPADLAALVLATARTATEKVAQELRAAVAPVADPLDLDLSPGGDPAPDAGPDTASP